ncbi:MAG TPA: SRPBCC domain-containing protein [Planctomycetota bacterium]|nr:SRPBCC domain-containing protein [Planctomycetota bacterium]
MTTASAPARRNGDQPFIIRRIFDAPRERVWRAWTVVDELKQWFGPTGFTMPTAKLDLRPGGTFHYALRSADGHEMWGKWVFREVTAPQQIVLINSFSDANGGVTSHPLAPTWPKKCLSTTTLSEINGRTTVEIRCTVWNGTAEEHQTFDAAHDGMTQGWGGTFDQLATYLSKTLSKTTGK